MSIVPFITDNGQTVVVKQEDFSLDRDALLILNMDSAQLTGKSSNVSYDLRVGQEYRDHRNPGKQDLKKGDEIVLYPGTAVIIRTEECIHLPKKLFALVVPKVGLLQEGLSNTMSKVDPGYDGHLLVTLFNLGKTTVRLKRFAPFCSLCVLRVDSGATLYDKPGKSIAGQTERPWWQRPRDWAERNGPSLTAILILLYIIEHIVRFIF